MASLILLIKRDVLDSAKHRSVDPADALAPYMRKMHADIDKYPDVSVLDKHIASGAVDANRVLTAKQAEENKRHLHNLVNQLESSLIAEQNRPELVKIRKLTNHPIFRAAPNSGGEEVQNYNSEMSDCCVSTLFRLDGSEESAAYNKRIQTLWNSGNIEDKRVVINELFQQAENVDIDKWSKRDIGYIMDHHSEFLRDTTIALYALTAYQEASDIAQIIPIDKAYEEKLVEMSNRAATVQNRINLTLIQSISPFGSLLNNTGFDRVGIVGRRKPEPVPPFADIDKYQDYLDIRRQRENYNRFVALCGERNIKVPESSSEITKRRKEFKDFPEAVTDDFRAALSAKSRGKALPWESEKAAELEKFVSETPDIAERHAMYNAAIDRSAYRRAKIQQDDYDAFVSRCAERSIALPATLKEYKERLNSDFADFPHVERFGFFESTRVKEKTGKLPWETDKCVRGAEAAKKYPDIDSFTDRFEEYEIDLHSMIMQQEKCYGADASKIKENAAEKYRSIGFALGCRAGEDYALIIGGEGEDTLAVDDSSFTAMTALDADKNDLCYAVDRRTGKIMAANIDITRENSGSSITLREATPEQIAALEKRQYLSAKDSVNAFRKGINDMNPSDPDMLALKKKLEKFDLLCGEIDEGGEAELYARLGEYKDALNDCIAELGLASVDVKKSCMRKAETNLMYEPDGRAVMLCDRIIDFAKRCCVGVPENVNERMRTAVIESTSVKKFETTFERNTEVKAKLDSVFDLLRNTRRGIRRDSDEFCQMMDCVKATVGNIATVGADNPLFTDEMMKEELRGIYTAAKDYLNYRSTKPTENARTVTRLEAARQIVDICSALDVKTYTPAEMLANRICNTKISAAGNSDKCGLIFGKAQLCANLLNDLEFNRAFRGYSVDDIKSIPKSAERTKTFIDNVRRLKSVGEEKKAEVKVKENNVLPQ